MSATHAPSAACATCPARDAHLVKLGVNPGDVDFVLALAGNPNTGKSTVFNALTGLRQHTGNWPGKTVSRAEGGFEYGGARFRLIDLPGTYSLLSTSQDEEVARDFILFGRPDVTIIVVDATRLERNLNLALQVLEITDRVVVCVNLMDEARRHGLDIDARRLARELGVPVVTTSARSGEGLEALNAAIHEVASSPRPPRQPHSRRLPDALAEGCDAVTVALNRAWPGLPNERWIALRLLDADATLTAAVLDGTLGELADPPEPHPAPEDLETLVDVVDRMRWRTGESSHQGLVETLYAEAARIADGVVHTDGDERRFNLERTIDRAVTSRRWGYPLMLLMLAVVFWITIEGANLPSQALSWLLLDTLHPWLNALAASVGVPWWLSGVVIDGAYVATAWVVSVMLPPMAIFFPLFTLLEDLGYLPRVAFNLDRLFQRAGGHGKQALTMTMGFGCNAAGVVATRIIQSPRERLVAILTNNFALCNGRWPTQILLATLFVGALAPPWLAGFASMGAVVTVALLGVGLTFALSWGLSRTVLRGQSSAFALELPPYRPPRLWQTLYTSLIDRTLYVLWRAIVFAAPAGVVIWLMANIVVADRPVAAWLVEWLDPLGGLIGLSGVILLAYVVAIPANEIVIPTILMLTVLLTRMSGVGDGAGVLFELEPGADLHGVLVAGGWTLLTAVNTMLFSLIHNPCSTTIVTIYKETRSWKWTALATMLPLVLGLIVCFFVAQLWRLLT